MSGVILMAVDPGRTTGYALFDGEKLLSFGQFAVNDDTYILVRLDDIFAGKDGYPGNRTRLRPALAIVEEASNHYHTSHRGKVGERAMSRNMDVNTTCRFRVEAALLKLGFPHLSVTPELWGARENVNLRARAELELAHIPIPVNFDIDAREHQRDAIALGGWAARRKIWEVR